MSVVLEQVLPPQLQTTRLDVDVRVSTAINVTAFVARQKVNSLVLTEVGTGLYSGSPSLVLTSKRACWRVPIIYATSSQGRVGQVGEIDVDVQTGELLADARLLRTIAENAERLATRPPLSTKP